MPTLQRQAPVTWSQLYEWVMQRIYEIGSPRIPIPLDLPGKLSATDIQAALERVVERHEALRTLFVVDQSGELVQVVTEPDGPPDLQYLEADASPAGRELVEELTARLARPFALADEAQLRAGVVTVAGVPRQLIVVVDHISLDAQGMLMLRRELVETLAAAAESREPLTAPPRRHPLDQAAKELRLTEIGADAAAMRYLDRQLQRAPHRMFSYPAPGGVAGGLRQASLGSASALACMYRVAGHYGITPPVAMLAVFSALVSLASGHELAAVAPIVGNRLDPRDRAMVGCLLQPVVIPVDLSGDPRFSEVVRRTRAACDQGYRHARYPTDKFMELHAARSFERGVDFDSFRVKLNFIDLRSRQTSGAEWADRPVDPPGSTEIAWRDDRRENPAGDLALLVSPYDDVLQLGMGGLASAVTGDDMERMLRGVELVLFAAATGGDPSLSEIAALTGVRPPDRDDGWLLIGSQWVNDRDVERLLRTAPGVSTASVFRVPGPDGRASLVAYVAAEDGATTPLSLRRLVIAAQPRLPSVVAPGWYVVCRQAPAPGPEATLARWRAQPAVLEGSGTTIPEVAAATAEEAALCRAIAGPNSLPVVSVEASYVLAGGRVRRIQAVQLALRREGFEGLSVRDFLNSASLRETARKLTPVEPGPPPAPGA